MGNIINVITILIIHCVGACLSQKLETSMKYYKHRLAMINKCINKISKNIKKVFKLYNIHFYCGMKKNGGITCIVTFRLDL